MTHTRFFVLFMCIFVVATANIPSVQAQDAVIPQEEKGNWWDVFFPEGPKGPSPAETLRAPFANEDAVVDDLTESGEAINATPLHLRHRTNDVMAKWVQLIVPALLSYKAETYNAQYSENIKLFTEGGKKEYLKFLQDASYITSLKSGQYDVSGFVESYPIVLNEGAVDGRYKWLFRTDIMITYLQKGVDPYKPGQDAPTSQAFELTFQIGRHRGIDNEHGTLLETWSIEPRNTEN